MTGSKPKTVFFSFSCQIAAFDSKGQCNLLALWAERAELLGYDVDGLIVEGLAGKSQLVKGEDGWNTIFIGLGSAVPAC